MKHLFYTHEPLFPSPYITENEYKWLTQKVTYEASIRAKMLLEYMSFQDITNDIVIRLIQYYKKHNRMPHWTVRCMVNRVARYEFYRYKNKFRKVELRLPTSIDTPLDDGTIDHDYYLGGYDGDKDIEDLIAAKEASKYIQVIGLNNLQKANTKFTDKINRKLNTFHNQQETILCLNLTPQTKRFLLDQTKITLSYSATKLSSSTQNSKYQAPSITFTT